MEQVALLNPARQWEELSIVILDDQQIIPLNVQYFNKDRATDVISFAYPPAPNETGYTGELFINAERALQLGPTNKGLAHEFALYLAHGCDHLSGADDQHPEEKLAMRRRELAWLKEAKEQKLLEHLIEPA